MWQPWKTLRWTRCECIPDSLWSTVCPLHSAFQVCESINRPYLLCSTQWPWDRSGLEWHITDFGPIFQMSHFKHDLTRQREGQATCQRWSDDSVTNLILLKCWTLNVVQTEASPTLPTALSTTPKNVILSGLEVEFYFKILSSNVEFYFLLFLNQINYSILYWIKPICYFLIFSTYPSVPTPKPRGALFLIVNSLIRSTLNKLSNFYKLMLSGENNKFLYT